MICSLNAHCNSKSIGLYKLSMGCHNRKILFQVFDLWSKIYYAFLWCQGYLMIALIKMISEVWIVDTVKVFKFVLLILIFLPIDGITMFISTRSPLWSLLVLIDSLSQVFFLQYQWIIVLNWYLLILVSVSVSVCINTYELFNRKSLYQFKFQISAFTPEWIIDSKVWCFWWANIGITLRPLLSGSWTVYLLLEVYQIPKARMLPKPTAFVNRKFYLLKPYRI